MLFRSQIFSARELLILENLLRRAGRVIPKTILESSIYGLNDEIGSNAIEVYVHRLRRRLADLGARAQIHTIRGVGYVISGEAPP